MDLYLYQITPVAKRMYLDYKAMEIHFAGSNFRAKYSTEADLCGLQENYAVSMLSVKKEIELAAKIVDAVLFTGGEPTLQTQVFLELLKFCKKKKLKTGLHTNGSKPDVVLQCVEKHLLDFLFLEVKAPLQEGVFRKMTGTESFFVKEHSIIKDIKRTIALVKQSSLDVVVVTTIVPTLLYRIEDISAIAEIAQELDCPLELRGYSTEIHRMDKKLSHLTQPTREFQENVRRLLLKQFPQMQVILA